jgi:hypothetical protein
MGYNPDRQSAGITNVSINGTWLTTTKLNMERIGSPGSVRLFKADGNLYIVPSRYRGTVVQQPNYKGKMQHEYRRIVIPPDFSDIVVNGRYRSTIVYNDLVMALIVYQCLSTQARDIHPKTWIRVSFGMRKYIYDASQIPRAELVLSQTQAKDRCGDTGLKRRIR